MKKEQLGQRSLEDIRERDEWEFQGQSAPKRYFVEYDDGHDPCPLQGEGETRNQAFLSLFDEIDEKIGGHAPLITEQMVKDGTSRGPANVREWEE